MCQCPSCAFGISKRYINHIMMDDLLDDKKIKKHLDLLLYYKDIEQIKKYSNNEYILFDNLLFYLYRCFDKHIMPCDGCIHTFKLILKKRMDYIIEHESVDLVLVEFLSSRLNMAIKKQKSMK